LASRFDKLKAGRFDSLRAGGVTTAATSELKPFDSAHDGPFGFTHGQEHASRHRIRRE
jgi:hypothetical protein